MVFMGIYDNPDVEDNNKGYALYKAGSQQKGLILMRKAASKGQPNAIASLIWFDLLLDRFDEAIKTYEEFSRIVPAWITAESQRINSGWFVNKEEAEFAIWQYKYQMSNSRSNAAIAYLAKGNKEAALRLWEKAVTDHNHLEARFYPILISKKEDLAGMRATLMEKFTKDELKALVNDMNDVTKNSNGWFASWAREGLGTLKAAANLKRPSAASYGQVAAGAAGGLTGIEIAARNLAKNYVQDQISADGEAEGAFDWFGDLFG
jgi:tetratricopeptide (TPR) repeat protein